MKSFFSRLQNKFSASFGGRYIEHIIKEISINDKIIIEALFPKIKKDISNELWISSHVEIEHAFDDRIADIALISNDNGSILALAEIKYDDHKNEKNSGQIDGYIKYCEKNKIPFSYITQYYPPKNDIKKIEKKYTHRLFSDLANHLKDNKHGELVGLFINFLEDKGLIMVDLDTQIVGKLLVRLFSPRKKQGRMNKLEDMTTKIPDSFAGLMTNINLISQEMYRYFPSTQKPYIDFTLRPAYHRVKDSDLDEQEFEPEEKQKNGGILYIFGRSKLDTGNKKWAYIEFGYYFEVKKENQDYNSNLYVLIYWQGSEDYWEEYEIKKSLFSDKQKCIAEIKKLTEKSIKKSLTDEKMFPELRKTLNEVIKNIKSL
jgi:hypothetical protein